MNKLKKISWLVVSLVGLFFAYGAAANEHYGDWEIEKNLGNQRYLSMKNEHHETMMIVCSRSMYFTAISFRYVKEDENKNGDFFDYQVDNHSVIFKGTKSSLSWIVPNVWFKENDIGGEIEQYKTLFQKMLQAKQSLTVNLIDAKGHIYRSANFSVKGLPEALVEFARQCGTDFQTYSGIEINQSDNHNK